MELTFQCLVERGAGLFGCKIQVCVVTTLDFKNTGLDGHYTRFENHVVTIQTWIFEIDGTDYLDLDFGNRG